MKRAMRSEPHPVSGFIYREIDRGIVRVEDQENGRHGLFRSDGTWIEGELTYADPCMLDYIGATAQLPPGWDVYWPVLPAEMDLDDAPAARPGLQYEAAKAAAQSPRIVGGYVPDPGKETPDGPRSAAFVDQDFFLANDRRPDLVPKVFHLKAPARGGPRTVGVERYLSRKYHDLEVERLWKKTWQMVCREDDVPEVGDYFVYDVADLSFLIVRTGERDFKAHYNACLHRGRQLRECSGRKAHEFRCPFHGWTWSIDGKIKHITTEWDFPGVRDEVDQLPGARVATWGGFIFINPDPEGETLDAFMGPEMIEHYAKFKFENRWKQLHVSKVVRANWKLAMEAFTESYHVFASHPQLLLEGRDFADSHYDVFGNWVRLGHVQSCVASAMRGMYPSNDQVLAAYRGYADFMKTFLHTVIGDEVEQFSDAELNDVSYSNLFPNFSPWGGFMRLVYRWRPHGDNPDECIMEVMLLTPWPKGKPKPPPVAVQHLGPDDSWTSVRQLGAFARVADQDLVNLSKVQRGLKTKQPPTVWFSAYQEGGIRNWHGIYDRLLGLDSDT